MNITLDSVRVQINIDQWLTAIQAIATDYPETFSEAQIERLGYILGELVRYKKNIIFKEKPKE